MMIHMIITEDMAGMLLMVAMVTMVEEVVDLTIMVNFMVFLTSKYESNFQTFLKNLAKFLL